MKLKTIFLYSRAYSHSILHNKWKRQNAKFVLHILLCAAFIILGETASLPPSVRENYDNKRYWCVGTLCFLVFSLVCSTILQAMTSERRRQWFGLKILGSLKIFGLGSLTCPPHQRFLWACEEGDLDCVKLSVKNRSIKTENPETDANLESKEENQDESNEESDGARGQERQQGNQGLEMTITDDPINETDFLGRNGWHKAAEKGKIFSTCPYQGSRWPLWDSGKSTKLYISIKNL